MKISLNWLNDFIELNLSDKEISDQLIQLGLESTFKNLGKSFSGIVLGKVIQCKPHPNADKLSVCLVDVGASDILEIVCGAPNVKENIFVPVATIGAELNNGDFKIKKTKLRGVVSNGMICSGKEIGYNDDHEGILILDTDEILGTPIEEIISFSEDVIFDLDLTPNRGDCLSHLGVARELGALSKQKISRKIINVEENGKKINDLISLHVDVPEACPRYVARIVRGVSVGKSPKWLVDRLESIGLKSINNIVDLANFVLMNTGHPMHTFDLNKISEKKINVRFAKKNEKFITLDNVERKLEDFHLLICDTKKPIALAGIMGGLNSEITDTTTDILIESAYFDPKVIRKGAKSLDLSTEASRRFERDTDIDALVDSVDELAYLIKEIAGGDISEGIMDVYPRKTDEKIICFSIIKCNALLGVDLKEKDIKGIFEMLDIKMIKDKDNFLCHIPSFRNDLERDVDLFEEVARIMGYDNIPSSNSFSGSFTSFVKDEQLLDDNVRVQLKSIGFHEHYSNSLLSEDNTKHFKSGKPVRIKNPLSKEMEFMRNSILPGLLMAASYNEKRQLDVFKLFEIGAIQNVSNKSYTNTKEKFHLGLVWHGKTALHWRKHDDRDIFNCKGEVVQFLNSLGYDKIRFKTCEIQGFYMSLKIFHDKIQLGYLGYLDDELKTKYDIKSNLIICDISMMELREIKKHEKFIFDIPSQYPSINRDIALQVKKDVSSGILFDTINKEGGDLLTDVSLFDIYESEDVGDDNKSLAFSLKFQSYDSTLTDIEVDPIINRIIESLNKCHGAIQR